MQWIISSAALITAASSAAPAELRLDRTVQLISMGSPDTQKIVRSEQPAEGGSIAEPRLPAGHTFRVHDLSRTSVEFEMREGQLQPAAYAEAPMAGPTVQPDSIETLTIPGWMRGDGPMPTPSSAAAPQCLEARYRPTGFLKTDAELRRARYFPLMSRAACEHGIPIALFDAMIIQESRYDPFALSPKRAFGLSQLMPGTAASLGVDRFDIVDNLRGGARYLRAHIERFGRYDLALAAYNAGPGRILNGRVPMITETRSYVDNILDYWSRLTVKSSNDRRGIYPGTTVANRRASLQYFQSSY